MPSYFSPQNKECMDIYVKECKLNALGGLCLIVRPPKHSFQSQNKELIGWLY